MRAQKQQCLCCDKLVDSGVATFRGHLICSKECSETWQELTYLEKEHYVQIVEAYEHNLWS